MKNLIFAQHVTPTVKSFSILWKFHSLNLALEICIKFLLVNTDKIISVKMIITIISKQCAKKVMSKSLGLVDFAIGLVNLVLNLPDGQMIFLRKFTLQKNWN